MAFLYTHNPFYAISAVLMLYGVRTGWGSLEIGEINSWIMLGVLAGYTLVLAAIAICIIRWGKVWDDARSLLLLLTLLFLAVSISADDLFVKSPSMLAGAALMLGGFVGSSLVSEIVLRGSRIRLSWLYRGPYHLMLGLFFAAPWWCSPELHPRTTAQLEWMIFLFPCAAAALFLMLIPAVRRGAAGVAHDGTPWPWPWYPWSLFGMIAAATAFRSFVLSMTFAPLGPIWKDPGNSISSINFETIFGGWFLVPLAAALLFLVLEASIASSNARLQQRVMSMAPGLLLLALPFGRSDAFLGFLQRFQDVCGSPIWLTLGLVLALYARAWVAGVPHAMAAFTTTMLAFSVVGRETVGLETLTVPQPAPLVAVAALLMLVGVRQRSSMVCAFAATLLTVALWMILPRTLAADFRATICYHVAWMSVVAIGLAVRDANSVLLRLIGALQMPLTALLVFASPRAEAVPLSWRVGYVVAIAVAAFVIGWTLREYWYRMAFVAMSASLVLGGLLLAYRQAASAVGRPTMAAMTWSFAALLIACLISASKAQWIPPRIVQRGRLLLGLSGEAALIPIPTEAKPPSRSDESPGDSTS
jgi:hypothetical protein